MSFYKPFCHVKVNKETGTREMFFTTSQEKSFFLEEEVLDRKNQQGKYISGRDYSFNNMSRGFND